MKHLIKENYMLLLDLILFDEVSNKKVVKFNDIITGTVQYDIT